MNTAFCIEALNEAIMFYGKPDILNSDQVSQFTSIEFTGVLLDKGIKISMNGKEHLIDNVFIERLCRSLKYESVYLNAFENVKQEREKISAWIKHYNQDRPHSTCDGATPNEIYNRLVKTINMVA